METISTQKSHFVKGARLNILTSVLAIPLFCLSVLPYAWLNGWQHTYFQISSLLTTELIIFLISGIFIHEGIHALVWILLLPGGFKSIKFGFNVHSLSPYTHCSQPMKVWQYRLGGLMPGLAMGFIPVVLSFIFMNTLLNFVGFLFLWAAGGDIIGLYLLRKLKPNSMVKDHPDEMGFLELSD